MKRLIPILVILAAVSTITAQVPDVVTASWSPPTEGSPAVGYDLEVRVVGGDLVLAVTVADTFYAIPGDDLVAGESYVGRVRAFDYLDRRGVWSNFGEPYTHDAGAPGATCAPVWSW